MFQKQADCFKKNGRREFERNSRIVKLVTFKFNITLYIYLENTKIYNLVKYLFHNNLLFSHRNNPN